VHYLAAQIVARLLFFPFLIDLFILEFLQKQLQSIETSNGLVTLAFFGLAGREVVGNHPH
jgi:hypothetical protein